MANEDVKKNAEDYLAYIKAKFSEESEKEEKQEAKEQKKAEKQKKAKEKAEKKKQEKQESATDGDNTKEPADWRETIKNDNRSAKNSETVVPTKKDATRVLKAFGIVVLVAVLVVALVVGGYFGYLQLSYSRIEDTKYLETVNNQSAFVKRGEDYSISTFNIGFGAYGQSFSFFMDEGEMMDGTKTKGSSARGNSEASIVNNTNGALDLVASKAESDFYFFQEVDTDSTRSHYVNQVEMVKAKFPSYAYNFAENAHSAYMFYPLSDPIGRMNSGIMTMSKYKVDHAIRRKFPISTGVIDKLFDLDRCFSVTKLNVSGAGKKLVLVNVHLSAYDDGGIREQQIKLLYDFMKAEAELGNYVIVGGDFNLSLAGDAGVFNNAMKTPAWCKNLPEGYTASDFAEIGYTINYDISTTIGTCRDASIKYTEGINLEVVIDGFITSSNVKVVKTEVVDGEFKYSDHNPVRMEFVLV